MIINKKNVEGWWLEPWSEGDTERFDLIANEDLEHVCDCVYGTANARLFLNAPAMRNLLDEILAGPDVDEDMRYRIRKVLS